MTRLAAAAAAAALALSLGGGAVFAGEVTGTGKSLEPLHGKSICAYSGLNDDPLGTNPANGPAGRTQSFGQDVRKGFIDPREFNPGIACNPNNGFGE
jgi:hypothetical protein